MIRATYATQHANNNRLPVGAALGLILFFSVVLWALVFSWARFAAYLLWG